MNRDPPNIEVSAKTNIAQRCALVKNVKIPSPEVARRQSNRGIFRLGERKTSICDLRPLRGLERLRGIDVEEGTVALDRDFRHRLAVFGDQMPGADIAIKRHQFVEEPP